MIKRRPPSPANAKRLELLAGLRDGQSFFEAHVEQKDLINLRRLCERRGFSIEVRKTIERKRTGCRITRRDNKR
jgi:hypothetical protein